MSDVGDLLLTVMVVCAVLSVAIVVVDNVLRHWP
jgi:hypothetical protein